MAQLIVSILSSLDGYCAGPGGALTGLPMGAAFDVHNLDCLRRAGTLLFGATTYPMFEGYWPQVDRGPGSDPVQREIAERVEASAKLLVSDHLRLRPDAPWVGTTTVVPRTLAHAHIRQLKATPGPDLLVYGSHLLYCDLLAHGLVDELHLLVANVLLGGWVGGCPPSSPAWRGTGRCAASAGCQGRTSWRCTTTACRAERAAQALRMSATAGKSGRMQWDGRDGVNGTPRSALVDDSQVDGDEHLFSFAGSPSWGIQGTGATS